MSSRDAELAALTVVVTRAVHQAGGLAELLREKGARVIELPTIAIADPDEWDPFDRALSTIERYTAVLIGSKNAAEAVKKRGFSISVPTCAVGWKTKKQLDGMKEVFTGEVFAAEVPRAEGMVAELERRFRPLGGKRFLHLRAPEGRETAMNLLEAGGAIVDAVEAYRIVPAERASAEAIATLETADVFTFLSGETLACFFSVLPEEKARALLDRARVAVIGPIAKERAEALGVRVDLVPSDATVESLVVALTDS